MGGTHDKLAGDAKEAVGKVTRDRELESKGKRQHAVGSVKAVAEDVKETAKDVKDRVTRR